MYIRSLKLADFRNIRRETLLFGEGTNIIYGKNAQGKTNIIEAIFYLAGAKSFRGASSREMIYYGENGRDPSPFSFMEAEAVRDGSQRREFTVRAELFSQEKKRLFVNGVRVVKYSEFFGMLRVVLFTPEHLRLVKDGPAERRAFLDAAICQLKPSYASMLADHNKKLVSRNALLKKFRDTSPDPDELAFWNEALAAASARITKTRREYVARLSEKAVPIYGALSGGEELSLSYKSALSEDGDVNALTDQMLMLLRSREKYDLLLGTTSVGAHRDDMDIYVNSKSARDFSSQGQQRSAVLALKLAEGDISLDDSGEYPVFLFDDVFSELDASRRAYLTERLSGKQIIMTSCEPALPGVSDSPVNLIRVEGGTVQAVKRENGEESI